MPGTFVGVLGAAQPAAADPAAAPSGPCDPIIELIRTLPWPVVVLVLALVLRRPPSSSATISDSTRMMLDQVQSDAQADFAVIALGTRQEWLTSRLYSAAAMLERMRGVQVLVFVERSAATERRLLAVAPARVARWALAQRYTWLEAAWARAYLELFPASLPAVAPALPPNAVYVPDPCTVPAAPSVIKSSNGGMDPYPARQLVSRFIDSLQLPAAGRIPERPRLGDAGAFRAGARELDHARAAHRAASRGRLSWPGRTPTATPRPRGAHAPSFGAPRRSWRLSRATVSSCGW